MSDDQQEKLDELKARHRLRLIDVKRSGVLLPFGPAAAAKMRSSVMGSTNFEDKDLEDMLAMVESAKPSDLESAADALRDAEEKIRSIGNDLKKHVDKVDWEGEFGESFREWGRKLSKNTLLLADYTEQASINLKTAGMGLAAVKSGMPKRNAGYAGIPRPEKIPAVERVEANEKYKPAKKKEEDRQEAINQMNRLASYYRVPRENMQATEEPQFGPMPSIGMPPELPRRPGDTPSGVGNAASGVGVTGTSVQAGGGGAAQDASPAIPQGAPAATPDGTVAPQYGQQDVRTDLNSVAPPVALPADSGPRIQPPSSGPVSSGPGLVAPPPPYNSQGNRLREAPRATSNPGPGTRGGGRGGATPNLPGSGAAARPFAGSGGTPMGRVPGTAPSPVGRGGGIIGGTPQQSGTAASNPHIPRGTVVGAEHGMAGRSPVGPGGVAAPGVGAAGSTPGRRLASSPGGIIGAPRSAPTQGAAPRPFTPGGTGLNQSGTTGGNQNTAGTAPRTGAGGPREPSRSESRRPDYLTEDEETWTTGRSGVVPPVIE